jgi:hypothetical protein
MWDRGYGAYRSAQHAGVAYRDDSADVITSLDDNVRFEIKAGRNDKHVWHKAITDWVQTAINETPKEKTPVVAWRPDRAGWIFLIPASEYAPGDYTDEEFIVLSSFKQMLNILDYRREYQVNHPEEWPESSDEDQT